MPSPFPTDQQLKDGRDLGHMGSTKKSLNWIVKLTTPHYVASDAVARNYANADGDLLIPSYMLLRIMPEKPTPVENGRLVSIPYTTTIQPIKHSHELEQYWVSLLILFNFDPADMQSWSHVLLLLDEWLRQTVDATPSLSSYHGRADEFMQFTVRSMQVLHPKKKPKTNPVLHYIELTANASNSSDPVDIIGRQLIAELLPAANEYGRIKIDKLLMTVALSSAFTSGYNRPSLELYQAYFAQLEEWQQICYIKGLRPEARSDHLAVTAQDALPVGLVNDTRLAFLPVSTTHDPDVRNWHQTPCFAIYSLHPDCRRMMSGNMGYIEHAFAPFRDPEKQIRLSYSQNPPRHHQPQSVFDSEFRPLQVVTSFFYSFSFFPPRPVFVHSSNQKHTYD